MVAAPPLRIVFFGTPAFAVPTLDALLASRHRVVGVVTQPDRPRGRGHKTTDAPVKDRALKAGLAVLQPERLKDPAFLADLTALATDLGVVAAYGKILNDAVLSTPRLGLINVHGSLLPKYRGAAPVHRAIIDGEHETGITIMRVVKALDAGPMLASVRRAIGPDETSDQVEHDLAHLGADLLVETVGEIAEGRATGIPQDDGRATYAHRLAKEDGLVNWGSSAERIHNLIRGLHPWPHAYSFCKGHRFILLRSTVVRLKPDTTHTDTTPVAGATAPPPGAILIAEGDRLEVATSAGVLRIDEIQTEGKRPLRTRDFLAGHHLQPGDRFGAP